MLDSFLVKDLMVPLLEYATVPMGSTLFEAALALEKAQGEFDHTKYRHRAVLILDRNRRVIGKLSQSDVLRAIEPREENTADLKGLGQFGFSDGYIDELRKKRRSALPALKDLYKKAMGLKVEEFMKIPSKDEYIEADASLDLAIHQLVLGPYLSLLVTKGEEVIGILRNSDVFAAVFHAMKQSVNEKRELS